jgi:hypothetical protein
MNTESNLDMATDSQDDLQSQEKQSARSFSQDDLDKIVADRVARERSKYEKKYGSIDIEQYQRLAHEAEQRQLEEQKARGEFENILKSTVEKKDSVIRQLQSELQTVKVDGQLIEVASRNRAVNPQQVVRLLKDQVRLAESGDVEVLGSNGQPRYTENGDPYGIADLVGDFLKENPHFVQAAPGGSGARPSAQGKSKVDFDITKLDMKNPEHRKVYAEYRKTAGLA